MPVATSQFTHIMRRALRLLLAHPMISVLAIGAWGLKFVEVWQPPLALFTTILGWILTAAFFGSTAAIMTGKASITWRSIGANIKQFSIGTVVIIMAYTIPLLLLIPVIAELLPFDLKANPVVLIIGFGPTVIPSIIAIWSLVLRRSMLIDAVIDGVRMLHGVWVTGIATGIAYQAAAYGTQALRQSLFGADTVLLILFEVFWIAVEALLRLFVVLWLFDETPAMTDKIASKRA